MTKKEGEKKRERDGTEGCAGGNGVVKQPSERLIANSGGYKYPQFGK